MRNVLLLHPNDNVAVALCALKERDSTNEGPVNQDIPAGHKLAISDIAAGEPIRKYSQIIGLARHDIRKGDHVHLHNVAMTVPEPDASFVAATTPEPDPVQPARFDGYLREDGRAATRNYIGILTSVNCSATVARAISQHFNDVSRVHANIDGVVALTHSSGCAMGGDGRGLNLLRKTLAGFARHPNFYAVLVIGLGCESNQIDGLLESQGLETGPKLATLSIQQEGGTTATVRRGIEIINGFIEAAAREARQPLPASHLTLALQCGGSDAFSGITANPALGAAADLLVRNGGSAILAETPEIYGAQHLLIGRARSPELVDHINRLLKAWEHRTALAGGEMDNNPSHGNKEGGLTTILEKSLGAVAKGGTTTLQDVLEYADPVRTRGLMFMDSPGYDPVSITGQIASGANVVAFTTGRGSVFGCKPVPSIKLSTTTALYNRMADDIDINCGVVLDGQCDIAQMGQAIFNEVLLVASGKKTKSEELGFGELEFAPWIQGPAM